jgi:dTDP-4-dehydrorhamnose 3,5-epimerase
MKIVDSALSGVLLLEPRVFGDDRGFFLESYNQKTMADLGIAESFVQDNHSYSTRNVIRGLHYQLQQTQGKLIRCAVGEIFDVAVDLRRSSKTFGEWFGATLSGENKRVMWIPPGFAHGFHVRSESAHVLYKASDFYHPASERTLLWNDPKLNISWELSATPIISTKDAQGLPFASTDTFA